MLKTKKEVKIALFHFKSLAKHSGWRLVVEILDNNIKFINQQIRENYLGMSKEEINAKMSKLVIYEEMRNTPQIMIERITAGKFDEPNFDPFETIEDVKKRRQLRKT